jgi:serine/threonine-protein kinase HipA
MPQLRLSVEATRQVPNFTDDLTASKAGIKKSDAAPVIDQVCEAADHFPTAARNMPLRLSTWRHISERVERSRKIVGMRQATRS